MKSIAVEALGRHLKGADASVPYSFGGFRKFLKNLGSKSELYHFYSPWELQLSSELLVHFLLFKLNLS